MDDPSRQRPVSPDRFHGDGWAGRYVRFPPARPWSALGGVTVHGEEWRVALPTLLAGLDGAWPRLKHDRSGTVAAGTLRLGGRAVEVVAKRPRRTRRGQWAVDLFRRSRADRAWRRTWRLASLGFDTEPPLLMIERRRLGVAVDGVGVYERVPGPTLHALRLSDLEGAERRRLLSRVGRTLRALADLNLGHFDAKAVNWIAFADPAAGLTPVMIDCDGVRPSRRDGGRRGMSRFLRALREHPDVAPADLDVVRRGFALGLEDFHSPSEAGP